MSRLEVMKSFTQNVYVLRAVDEILYALRSKVDSFFLIFLPRVTSGSTPMARRAGIQHANQSDA
jgi:hypothetical protein